MRKDRLIVGLLCIAFAVWTFLSNNTIGPSIAILVLAILTVAISRKRQTPPPPSPSTPTPATKLLQPLGVLRLSPQSSVSVYKPHSIYLQTMAHYLVI